jgi:hypothetical protein
MGRWGRRLVLALVAFLAAALTLLNAGQRVSLDIGFTVLYRISLVGLVLLAFVLGMVTMFLLGLEHDLRVRRTLREHGLLDRRPRAWPPDYPEDYPPP